MTEIDPVLYYRMRETVATKGDILSVAWTRLVDPPENATIMPISIEMAERFLTRMEPTINWEIVQGIGKNPILKRVTSESTTTSERIILINQYNPNADIVVEKLGRISYILSVGDNVDIERHGSVVMELALCDYMRPQAIYELARIKVSDIGDGVQIFLGAVCYGRTSVYAVRYFDTYGLIDADKRY